MPSSPAWPVRRVAVQHCTCGEYSRNSRANVAASAVFFLNRDLHHPLRAGIHAPGRRVASQADANLTQRGSLVPAPRGLRQATPGPPPAHAGAVCAHPRQAFPINAPAKRQSVPRASKFEPRAVLPSIARKQNSVARKQISVKRGTPEYCAQANFGRAQANFSHAWYSRVSHASKIQSAATKIRLRASKFQSSAVLPSIARKQNSVTRKQISARRHPIRVARRQTPFSLPGQKATRSHCSFPLPQGQGGAQRRVRVAPRALCALTRPSPAAPSTLSRKRERGSKTRWREAPGEGGYSHPYRPHPSVAFGAVHPLPQAGEGQQNEVARSAG